MKRPPLELTIVTLWVLGGILLPGIPGAWGVFPLLGVIPGLVAARALPLADGPLARWALGLAAAPLVTTVAAWLLMAAGLSLPHAGLAVAVLAWLAWALQEARATATPSTEKGERFVWKWALGGALAIAVVLFANPILRVRGDAWVHGGIVWEIVERGLPPQDPRFAGLTLNYVWFYNYFIALLASLRGGDPFVMMALSNVASLFATLALGALLARALWGDRRAMIGGTILLGLGYNAGVWLLWPTRLLRALVGRDHGPAELARDWAAIHFNDALVIFTLNAPFSYMASFLDKFLHGTAINVAYLMMIVYLWAMVRALDGERSRAWAWGAAGAAGMLLFHGVVGLSVLPVALAALALAWLLAGRWRWLPARARLAGFGLATLAGALLAAPYTRAISRGWAASKSGLQHSYLQLDPMMWWTIVTALAVAVWFARCPLRRVLDERRGAPAVLALFAAGMIAFSCVVSLPLGNHVKFIVQAFVPLAVLGGAAFHDELAAWRRRLGTTGAVAVFALVLCGPAVLTLRGYLIDPSGAAAPELHPAPGEEALYAWMRTAVPRRAVVIDHHFRSLIMVTAHRQLLLGDTSGPERAAYPLDQVIERRAVMADLYGGADSLDRDLAVLGRLDRPAYVVVRSADFAAPDPRAPPRRAARSLRARVRPRWVRRLSCPQLRAPTGRADRRPTTMSSSLAPASKRLLVVMPAHNEQESVGTTLDRVRAALPEADLLVVNDYSSDQTTEVALAHGARVVELPWNLGYGGAVQTGFKYAVAHGYDVVLQMDADGQHDPGSARGLLAPVLAGEADVAIGSRFLGRANYPIPGPRRLGMKVFSGIVTFVTRQRFSDPTSGFQALDRRVVEFFAFDHYPSDFPDADTIILLALAGFRVREVPVTMEARVAGTSMHSNLTAFYYVAKMTLSILMVLLRRKRLRA